MNLEQNTFYSVHIALVLRNRRSFSTDSIKRLWRASIYYTYLSTNDSTFTGHFGRIPMIGIIE